MRLPLTLIQRGKAAVHCVQALLIFIAWAITIAILVSDGPTDGRSKYFFAMCWITIPALVYLAMVPMWSKVKRFANAYAFAALDVLLALLWFAAFVSVATWNNAGISEGEKKKKPDDKDKDKQTGCAAFAFGSEKRCSLSQATVGFGGVIFALFVITGAISIYGVIFFRKNGYMPGSQTQGDSIEDHTKDAFSTNDQHEYGRPGAVQGGTLDDDEDALLHSNEMDGGRHPGPPAAWGRDDPELDDHHHGPYTEEYDDHAPVGYGQLPEPDFGHDLDTSYGSHPPSNHPPYPV